MTERNKDVVVLTGAGSIGLAIARRVGAGKHIVIADLHLKNAEVAELLMGERGAFITGSDLLMDGGVTASYWYGELSPKNNK